jgi:hypothetical protein
MPSTSAVYSDIWKETLPCIHPYITVRTDAQKAPSSCSQTLFLLIEKHKDPKMHPRVTYMNMAHGAQVIDLIRADLADELRQVGRVRQVAIVQVEAHTRIVPVLVQVLDPLRIEGGRTTDDAVYYVALWRRKHRREGSHIGENDEN